jgi:hypothetical protein
MAWYDQQTQAQPVSQAFQMPDFWQIGGEAGQAMANAEKNQWANQQAGAVRGAYANAEKTAVQGEPYSEYLIRLAKRMAQIDPEKASGIFDLASKQHYYEANKARAEQPKAGIPPTSISSTQRASFKGANSPETYKAAYDNLVGLDPTLALVAGIPASWDNGGAYYVASINQEATKKNIDLKTIMANAQSIMQNVNSQESWTNARNLLSRQFNISDEDLSAMGLGAVYNQPVAQVIQEGGKTGAIKAKGLEATTAFDIAKSKKEMIDYTQSLSPKQAQSFDAIVKDVTGDARVKASLDGMASAKSILDGVTEGKGLSGLDAVTQTYRYLKSIDPGSAVREAEVEMFANAAGKVNSAAERMVQTGQAPDIISALNSATILAIAGPAVADMKRLSQSMLKAYQKTFNSYVSQAKMRGKVYGVGDQTEEALNSLNVYSPSEGAIKTDANGKSYTVKNGERVYQK